MEYFLLNGVEPAQMAPAKVLSALWGPNSTQAADGLSLATACSGTDSPIVLAKLMGLETSFSCEFDELKRTPGFAQGSYLFIFLNGKSIMFYVHKKYIYHVYVYIYIT